jgi:hypothetical protein
VTPVRFTVPREPVTLWVAAGPALTAISMALRSSDASTRTPWSLVLLGASLALIAVVLIQRWWTRRG